MLHRRKNTAVDNLSSLFEDVDKKNTTAMRREHEKDVEEPFKSSGSKKNLASTRTREERIEMIERDHPEILLSKKAELLSLNRTSLYYKPEENQRRRYASGSGSTRYTQITRRMGLDG